MTTHDIEDLDAILAHLEGGTKPGVIVSVQRGGTSLLRRGYGLASLDSGIVNSPSTKMRIGSTSKHFCCALALLLRNEGRLSIDEPIARWLPELPASQGSRTLRQLMNHTGGIRDYLDLSLLSNGLAIAPDEAAFDYQCRQEEENFTPGERFIYNNGGYRLLSLVIERVLDMPLAQALHERLFEPLSMHDTSLWPSDLSPLPGSAATHLAHPDGTFTKSLFPSIILGEGGIASTLDDMQRWLAHLITPTLWPQAVSNEMMAPTVLSNGFVNPYGFGLIRERWRGVTVVHHAGGVVGGTCQMLAAPEHDIQIIVMSNRSDAAAAELAQKLLQALVGESLSEADEAADPALADTLAGQYFCSDSGRYFAIEARGQVLYLMNFGMPLPLLQGEDGRLRVNLLSVIILDVQPVIGDGGAVAAIEVTEQGHRYRCTRIATADSDARKLAAFAGSWHSKELGADVRIDGQGAMHVAGLYGRNRYKLEALRDGVCQVLALDPHIPLHGILTLGGRADGRRELLLDTSRTRRLRLLERPIHG